MLFEIHDIILHRLWKAAKKARSAYMKRIMFSTWYISRWECCLSGVYYWAEKTTARWYFNHHPKLSNNMIPYVRVFNGLPW